MPYNKEKLPKPKKESRPTIQIDVYLNAAGRQVDFKINGINAFTSCRDYASNIGIQRRISWFERQFNKWLEAH